MVEKFFTFLQNYRGGILFFLVCLASIALLVQWFAWIFGKGRYRKDNILGTGTGTGSGTSRAELRYIFSEATVKIINDFRHLLALVIVLIFGIALLYSLIRAATLAGTDGTSAVANMKEALQAVVATLGGLVGSIIGYYFGESSVAKASSEPVPPTPPPDAKPITATAPPDAAMPADQ